MQKGSTAEHLSKVNSGTQLNTLSCKKQFAVFGIIWERQLLEATRGGLSGWKGINCYVQSCTCLDDESLQVPLICACSPTEPSKISPRKPLHEILVICFKLLAFKESSGDCRHSKARRTHCRVCPLRALLSWNVFVGGRCSRMQPGTLCVCVREGGAGERC